MDFEKILEGIGIKSEALNSIKLGRGVIGKSATIGLAALIVLGVVAYKLTNEIFLMIIAGSTLLLFFVFFVGAMMYGSRNPAAALLEGAELITWHRDEMASKSLPKPPMTPLIADPKAGRSET